MAPSVDSSGSHDLNPGSIGPFQRYGYVRDSQVRHPGLARLDGPAIDVDFNPTVARDLRLMVRSGHEPESNPLTG
jgi:hypothetical protein